MGEEKGKVEAMILSFSSFLNGYLYNSLTKLRWLEPTKDLGHLI